MEAESLRNGFRLGDWLVEPAQSRASTADRVVELDAEPLRLLLALAARPGQAIDRRSLRAAVWPDERVGEERLRETVAALRAALGENARHPRYIAAVGSEGYVLIGQVEPVAPAPAPAASDDGQPRSAGRLHSLLGELRRRNVFKVAASYLVGMWIVLQVAQVTFAPLRFPDWWMTALTILAVIGLPIVAVLAWTYEITPQGIVVDAGADGAGVARRLPRARQSVAPFIVAGVALMAAVTGFAWWRSLDVDATAPAAGATAPEPGARSVAVLALVDMSAEGGNSYLGDGLSEELSTRLAQVPGLRVAARTSAFEFKGRNLDVRKIGQALGVRHVLEGSVRRQQDNVRVTVQLIDAATGYHVWAGNFDRPWSDVLTLQDDIAKSVTDALQLVFMESAVGGDPGRRHTVDARAIDPYLAGLAALRQPGDMSRLRQAETSFRQAIEADAEFAGAYAGLCRTHAREFERTRDPLARDAAQDICRKALALDPDLVETHKALASTAMVEGRYDAAQGIYASLVERNPQDADAYVGLGEALAGLGDGAAAEAHYRRAVAVEPAYWSAHAALASHLFARGKIDESIAEWRKVTELVPSSANAWSNLGGALNVKGDFGGALEAYDRSLKLEPSKEAYSNLATAYFFLERFPEAVANYERAAVLGEHDYLVQGNLADALWQTAGRREDAVARYRRAIALAEKELEARPSDWAFKAQLGYFYGRVGDTGRAQAYLEEALARGPEIIYVHYFVGVDALDRGDRATALRAIAELVRMGYSPVLLRSAPEFRSLRQDPEYQRIVGSS
jgi:TolB-like protein/tetratricopeptide (TPR) repeat protein/DNA-binding winged helix-turn-helix (wHTH) protein